MPSLPHQVRLAALLPAILVSLFSISSHAIRQAPSPASLHLKVPETQTHALLVGSPAIGAAAAASCPATDQRGVTRPQGAGCDIGAYEVEVL